MEERKIKEEIFTNKARNKFQFNKKCYSITRESENFFYKQILKNIKSKNARILDYGCGSGIITSKLSAKGFNVIGVDISNVNIKVCKENTRKKRIKNVKFYAMDCEKTKFPENYFDIIVCHSILHHLNIEKAFQELRRILKPAGKIICLEPVAYNPLIQLYRKLTPNLRTKWEIKHILTLKDIEIAKKYFNIKEVRYFHLFTLFAIPLANTKLFNTSLDLFERVDEKILKMPIINKLAWQIVIITEGKK